MYELTIETVFAAAHAIVMNGQREPVHGHNWHVTACVAGDALDSDGLLCDFHEVESALRHITGGFHNKDLNASPPFDKVNPTAELIARHIGEELARHIPARSAAGNAARARGVRVAWIRVTEAPGCAAIWKP